MLPGCGDFFETDISNIEVNLLAPADSLVSTTELQTFWWDYIDGAYQYQLRIVNPCFSEIETIIVDSLVNDNKIKCTLSPGIYQWGVRAVNGNSETDFSIRSLTIIELNPETEQ